MSSTQKPKAVVGETPEDAERRRRRDPFWELRRKSGVVIKSVSRSRVSE